MRHSLGQFSHCEAGVWLTLGRLVYDDEHCTGLVGLDLRPVLPWLDRHEGEDMVWARCVPYENIDHPPLLRHDVQWTGAKDKRVKVGFVFTKSEDTGAGAVQYILAIDRDALLKGGWRVGSGGMLWLHLHDPANDEAETKNAGVSGPNGQKGD